MIPVTEIIDWQGITLSVIYTPQGHLAPREMRDM